MCKNCGTEIKFRDVVWKAGLDYCPICEFEDEQMIHIPDTPADRLEAIRKRAKKEGLTLIIEQMNLAITQHEQWARYFGSIVDDAEKGMLGCQKNQRLERKDTEIAADYLTCELCGKETLHRFGGLCSNCEQLD